MILTEHFLFACVVCIFQASKKDRKEMMLFCLDFEARGASPFSISLRCCLSENPFSKTDITCLQDDFNQK
jgi:hypothetical protein